MTAGFNFINLQYKVAPLDERQQLVFSFVKKQNKAFLDLIASCCMQSFNGCAQDEMAKHNEA